MTVRNRTRTDGDRDRAQPRQRAYTVPARELTTRHELDGAGKVCEVVVGAELVVARVREGARAIVRRSFEPGEEVRVR